MKKILLLAISAMLIMVGCEKNETDDNKPNKPDSEKPDDQDSDKLPELPDPTDVCSGMDDIEFMKYCYDHFDVNKDGKISEQEYNAVKEINCDSLQIFSFKGIEYFANLETFSCKENTKIKTVDLSHNKKITSIVEKAFYNCKSLTSIAIPDSVTEIGSYAFRYCTGLTSVTIPDSVISIGIYAFSGCTGLTSVTIPDSVTSIDEDAFKDCTSLSKVNITDLVAWCSIKFSTGYSNPLYYAHNLYLNGKLVTDLVIPDSVTSYAFYGCKSLTSVTIPDSVTEIGWAAFASCAGLTSVTIGNSVTEIGGYAFFDCTSLTSVVIPNSVTEIGRFAFYGCTGLKEIYCKPTIPPTLDGSSTFKDIASGAKIYVPRASLGAYKSAKNWNSYASKITGIDF